MVKEKYKVLGVMSGTSLDGIDCAVVEFTFKNSRWNYEFLMGKTLPYPDEWTRKLQTAILLNQSNLHLLNIEYTYFLGEMLNEFLIENQLTDLDFISSHGHTVLHQPERGITLQIGNLPIIADMMPLPFVCDFRVQDVKLGGQGAPLVPMGDRLLFADFDYCLNLGGFSNISFEEDGERLAFDICPVNTLLNHFAQKEGKVFDNGGKLAQQGTVDNLLLETLNDLEFYQKLPPKSLGMEQVNNIYLPLLNRFKLSNRDILATLTEHIAFQIAEIIKIENSRLLITGGGAFNTYLIHRMKYYLPKTQIVIGSEELIMFKEAIVFGFLGVLRMEGINNVLSSVTGAKTDHCSGVVYNSFFLGN